MVFSWQMAEELAAAHLRSIGFLDARRTANGADGGIDVVASEVVAQVKYLAQPVGSPDIHRLRGAGFAYREVVFYSLSGYTASAIAAAAAAGVALFSFTNENEVIAVNDKAVELDLFTNLPSSITAENAMDALRAVRAASALRRRNQAKMNAFREILIAVRDRDIKPYEGIEKDIASSEPLLKHLIEAEQEADELIQSGDFKSLIEAAERSSGAIASWQTKLHVEMNDFEDREARILKRLDEEHQAQVAG